VLCRCAKPNASWHEYAIKGEHIKNPLFPLRRVQND
jgi:hypothetical protein